MPSRFHGERYTVRLGSKSTCNEDSCQSHTAWVFEAAYFFPYWFLARAIYLIIGTPLGGNPTFRLTLLKRVEYTSEIGFFRMVETGNTKTLISLLDSRKASPSDVDITYGRTALCVSVLLWELALAKRLTLNSMQYQTTIST